MNRYILPKEAELAGSKVEINTDFRQIIKIMSILDDPDLLESERIIVSLKHFYKTDEYLEDVDEAISFMMWFIRGGQEESNEGSNKPLYDWDKDFDIIVSPVNRILGQETRAAEHLHWWTFLSAFMEIGESTFSTFVSIRDKLNRGIRLDKEEEKIYRNNKSRITLTKKVDSTTQSLMDEILGKGV